MRAPPPSPDHLARIAAHAQRVAVDRRPRYRKLDMSAIQRTPKPKPKGKPGRPVGSGGISVGIVGTGRRFESILEAAYAMVAECRGDVEISAAQHAINRASRDGRPAFGRQWYRTSKPGVWWNRGRKAA